MPNNLQLTTRIERITKKLRKEKGNAWGGFAYVPNDGRAIELPVERKKLTTEEDEGWDVLLPSGDE
jgi:hypothetical protein